MSISVTKHYLKTKVWEWKERCSINQRSNKTSNERVSGQDGVTGRMQLSDTAALLVYIPSRLYLVK